MCKDMIQNKINQEGFGDVITTPEQVPESRVEKKNKFFTTIYFYIFIFLFKVKIKGF